MKKLFHAIAVSGRLAGWLGGAVIAGVLTFLGALLDGRGGTQ